MVFFTLFGYWVCVCVGGGGAPKGLVHNVLMDSKVEVSKLSFFHSQ